jgi:uncharacterized protein YoxC
MLSIFEQKEFERQPERKLTLNRLQNVLGPQSVGGGTAVATGAVVVEPAGPVAVPEPVTTESRPVGPRLAEPPVGPPPPPAVESNGPPIPAELQNFAEQFTRGFREVLANTVREIQSPIAEEQKKLDTVFDHLAKSAREVDALHGDLNSAYGRLDSLTKSVQELTARLGRIEDAVNIATAASHAIQDGQQALEKRLELQAGVIRSLHASTQSREERLDKILSTFQALQGVSTERATRRPLPDEL